MEKFTWKTQRVCSVCNASFLPVRNWQIACSYRCGYTRQNAKKIVIQVNLGNCARCNNTLSHKRIDAIYCSKTCLSMDHTAKHRAKTRVQGVARRRIMWERDNGICYICGDEVRFDGFELDHLVPVSRGGDNHPNNLAVTHQMCNRRRGTRIEEAQLRKLFELRDKI
jgi:hypothetical protein